ncbi:MAG: FISUMP domain-containing protein [Bacteroidota bacterium]
MQLRDLKRFFGGLNKDDHPSQLPDGDYVDGLNIRTGSSDSQHEAGIATTLQGEIEVLIGVSGVQPTYYGGLSIGGEFIYTAYAEVKIGDQVWMGKNWNAAYPNSKVYDNNEANRDIYGGLYTHNQTMAADFCPAGWRVPTEADIDDLLTYLGGETIAGGKLKEPGTLHWDAPNTGAPGVTAFRALPGGKFDLLFSLLGSDGFFWLQDEGLEVPLALDATGIAETSFFANWQAVDNADGYYLDVARDAAFTLMVSAYNNRDAGNVVTYPVAGLSDDSTYFYRVRAYEDAGSSENSNIITLNTLVGEDVEYVILTDGVTSVRKGIRGGSFVVDITITPTGFAGIENEDWKKIKDIVLAMGGGGV